MGLITWTDTNIDGDIYNASEIDNMKNDITSQLNGNLSDANFSGSGAVAESNIAFDISAGHDHDGSNSKSLAISIQHYRKGLTLSGDDDANVVVDPGSMELAGTVFNDADGSGDLAIVTDGNWISGLSGKSASTWGYVYAFNDSGTLTFKLHTVAPNLSDTDENANGPIFRYIKVSDVMYRCLGSFFMDADQDLTWGQSGSEGEYGGSFDASNTYIIAGKGTGADQTFNTLWTPRYVHIIYGTEDGAPGVDESIIYYHATQRMLDTNWFGTQLNAQHAAALHDWRTVGDAGAIKSVTAQSAGTSGSFTVNAMVADRLFYLIASTDRL